MESFVSQRILDLLMEDPSAVTMIKTKYLSDEVWQFCIDQEPKLFKYMRNPSIAMCEYALEKDGNNLRYVKKVGIRITMKMAYLAVTVTPESIFEVPKELISKGLRELAMEGDFSLIGKLGKPSDAFITKLLLNHKYEVLEYVTPSEKVLLDALDNDPYACCYIKELTPNMKDLIRAKYPYFVPMIPSMRDEVKTNEEINTGITSSDDEGE